MDLTGGIDRSREPFLTDAPDEPTLREAINMWIWDDAGRFGLPRIGVEAVAGHWQDRAVQANIAFPDGRVLIGSCRGAAHDLRAGRGAAFGAGPMAFECVEPFERWNVAFGGPAIDTSLAEQVSGEAVERQPVDVAFSIEATMAIPAYLPVANTPFNVGPGGAATSSRYEQLFRARGTFRVGDREMPFEGGGLRVRRQGNRDSTELPGHCWQSALFPSGRAFSYIAYLETADASRRHNAGYVFDGRQMTPARAVHAPWMSAFEPFGGDVSVTLETAAGAFTIAAQNAVSVYIGDVPDLNRRLGMPFLGGGGKLAFQQGIARYRWDGEEGYGMIERSYPLADLGPAQLSPG
jgi:hypothetical protein